MYISTSLKKELKALKTELFYRDTADAIDGTCMEGSNI